MVGRYVLAIAPMVDDTWLIRVERKVPSALVDNKSDREKAFGAAIDFILEAHRRK